MVPFLLYLGLSLAPLPQTPPPQPERWVVLEAHEARKLASRRAAGRPLKEWNPTDEEVAALRQQLPAAYRSLAPKDAGHLDQFYLQFAGCLMDGQKTILINAFTRELVDIAPNWRTTAIIAFGGGANAWSMTYSPTERTFSEPMFNGEAGLADSRRNRYRVPVPYPSPYGPNYR